MAVGKVSKRRLSYADLCEMFPGEDNVRREIIDGELLVTPSATARHQRVVGRIFMAIETWAREHGGEAFVSPLDTQFTDEDVVQPDVLYVAPEHVDQALARPIRELDLVVEVSSPGTTRIDLGRKRELYERHGVPEYWFVDLEAERFEIYRLERDRYGAPVFVRREGHVTSPVLPGFEAAIEELLGPEPEGAG